MTAVRPCCLLVAALVASCAADTPQTTARRHREYCVIGAGPGGLQMAYFLQRANRDYLLFERGRSAGTFFNTYPRHDTLISINKRHTGKLNREFNMRHDWNSLLSHDDSLLFKHYSKEFFPPRSAMVEYLEAYCSKLNLSAQFNTDIRNIEHHPAAAAGDQHFTMQDQRNNTYTCHYVIMANGVSVPNKPYYKGSHLAQGYEDIPLNTEDYEGQSVMILGRGNTAFEVAQSIYGHTAFIHMLGRSRVKLSWSTHYVGDIRAVNNGLLDTYQLKSLDGVAEAPVEDIVMVRDDGRAGKIWVRAWDDEWPDNITDEQILREEHEFDNIALREGYDRVIRCLGFKWDASLLAKSSVPGGALKKYPAIGSNYGARNVSGLYFAGTNTHSLDHRKSAGGFIHGFRYTARALHRYLENVNHGVTWPHIEIPITGLLNHIIKRINEASGLYQMFSVLSDITIISKDGLSVKYFEEFPVNLVANFTHITGIPVTKEDSGGVIICMLQYGADFSRPGADTFRLDRATLDPLEGHLANFLHPLFYYYTHMPTAVEMSSVRGGAVLPRPQRLHHLVEDFHTLWLAPESHLLPLRRFLEAVVGEDLRTYTGRQCVAASLVASDEHLPVYCRLHYLATDTTTTTTAPLIIHTHNERVLHATAAAATALPHTALHDHLLMQTL